MQAQTKGSPSTRVRISRSAGTSPAGSGTSRTVGTSPRTAGSIGTSIDGATGSTYTATDDDAGYELVCKVSSTDDICQGTISGATGAVKKILAFAVYSADDGSLSFYKRAEVPKQGTMYLGKRATAVYTGLENMTSIPGWMLNYSKDIKTAIVYDEGISPIDTGFWFAELRNMKTADVSKLDMSKCKTIGCMFTNCTSLTTLDLSAWDTRSLTDMNQAFQNCTSLTKLNVSGWDVSKVTNMTLSFAEDRTLSSLDLSTWDNSAVTSMKDVFSMMDSLNEVSLGSKFKFVGTSPFLPDQTGHVAGADGKWYDTDGNGYAPADIPSNKAMTYYASKDLVPGITISGNAEVGETLTATVNNLSEEEITGYQWYTVDDSSNETAIANATAHTYTVTANEVGKKILCKAFYKNGSATKNVKTTPTDNVTPQKTAFAVYSADDNSLDFYKRTEVPTAGSTFKGKTATAVYTGIETYTYTRNLPWNGYASKIKTATVVDDGLQPKSTASWFTNCKSITQCDMSKLDTSTLADASGMFYNCSSLTTIGDLSSWDVSNLADASDMFYSCSSLTTIGDLSGWDVSNLASSQWMFFNCSRLSVNCSSWDVSKVTNHSNFNTNAPGVILPLAWQTSSDEGDENSAIAPLCEEQGNGDALSVPSENDNNDADEAASKTDGKASADSETEGSNTASADDAGAKEEEASGNIVQEEPTAA